MLNISSTLNILKCILLLLAWIQFKYIFCLLFYLGFLNRLHTALTTVEKKQFLCHDLNSIGIFCYTPSDAMHLILQSWPLCNSTDDTDDMK